MRPGDGVSKVLVLALDLLFVRQPVRTSLGAMLAGVLDFFFRLFEPFFEKMSFMEPTNVKLWHFVCLGVLVLHLPTLWHSLRSRPVLDESIERAFEAIGNSDLSRKEQRERRRRLIDMVIQRLVADTETGRRLGSLRRQVEDFGSGGPETK